MPYTSIGELPAQFKSLPTKAKQIAMNVINSALGRNASEESAFKQAWGQIKQSFRREGDKWVAKESQAELQAKYDELQEAGKRNASVDATRLKQILKLVQELLDREPEEAEAEEAMRQANEFLAELGEAEIKTEDGQQYPSAAFAYVPDPDKPSTWKLRLWETPQKKVTRPQLGRAAAALSPGGYRGQKVQIPPDDLASVKRNIRGEYKKLGVDDEDIPRWVKEVEMRIPMADYIPLSEGAYDKGEVTLTVIKPGFNLGGGRYYPEEVLKRDHGIFEGVKMYADHPTVSDEKQRPERSIRDWVATLGKPWVESDGTIKSKATIVEPWMQEKLAMLRDKDMLGEMGVSINAVGTASKQEIQGQKTNMVERLVRARSVDFVTEAGAGGGVSIFESISPETDIDLIDIEALRERRPDLIQLIEADSKETIREEARKQMEIEVKLQEVEGQLETVTKERDEAVSKLAEADKAREKAEAQANIAEAVGKAELPQVCKDRLLKQFSEAHSAEGIEDAIKEEQEYIASLSESGKIRGMGPSNPPEITTEEIEKTAREQLGMTEAAAKAFAKGR